MYLDSTATIDSISGVAWDICDKQEGSFGTTITKTPKFISNWAIPKNHDVSGNYNGFCDLNLGENIPVGTILHIDKIMIEKSQYPSDYVPHVGLSSASSIHSAASTYFELITENFVLQSSDWSSYGISGNWVELNLCLRSAKQLSANADIGVGDIYTIKPKYSHRFYSSFYNYTGTTIQECRMNIGGNIYLRFNGTVPAGTEINLHDVYLMA